MSQSSISTAADARERTLRLLAQAAAEAPSIRVEIDDWYRRAIARVEALPANQSGSDKTWIWEAEDSATRHFAAALPAR